MEEVTAPLPSTLDSSCLICSHRNKVLLNIPFLMYVFYCFITDCHKVSSLKQHTSTTSQFPWVRSPGTVWMGPLLRVSQAVTTVSHKLYFHQEAQLGKSLLLNSFGWMAKFISLWIYDLKYSDGK